MIRIATISDIPAMDELMLKCFGVRNSEHRAHPEYHVVYEENGKIVAMTGMLYSEDYKATEIAYTCTHPDYRNRGIMHSLFDYMFKNKSKMLQWKSNNVYCSCWQVHGAGRIHLYSLMRDFGFECIIPVRVTYKCGVNCHFNESSCCNYIKDDCACLERLYVKRC